MKTILLNTLFLIFLSLLALTALADENSSPPIEILSADGHVTGILWENTIHSLFIGERTVKLKNNWFYQKTTIQNYNKNKKETIPSYVIDTFQIQCPTTTTNKELYETR